MSVDSYQTKIKKEIETVVDDILEDYKPRPIRDDKVIRDAIFGFNLYYKHELNLIDSPLLQRLRGIFQTCLALYTYPSACHSRFEHSLGCVAVAEKMLKSLESKGKIIDPVNYMEVRLAALLHDCGHGPFSHGSEEIYWASPEISNLFGGLKQENPDLFYDAKPHEILGYFIVTSERFRRLINKEIPELYKNKGSPCDLSLINPKRIGYFILGEYPENKPSMKYLAQIINGPFDVVGNN